MQAAQRTRPMRRDDIADVARLFFSVFRKPARTESTDFQRYYERVFFEAPGYAAEAGGMVGLDPQGRVASAISALPIPFRACGRRVAGRLICAFVADPHVRDSGATPLSLALHPRHQDFSFTDTASARSADLTRSVGAVILPVHSLDWTIPFRPLAARLERRPGTRFAAPARLLATLVSPIEGALAQRPALPRRTRIAPIAPDAFAAGVPALLERFAIHPDFDPGAIEWLLARAGENTAAGTLTLYAVTGHRGETLGLVAVYLRAGRLARVLNVFTIEGAQDRVIGALCAQCCAMGATGVTGLAQPFLLAALARQRGMRLRPRGFFCVSTRHADIRQALARNDIYIGGLAGECWSRLVNDWH